MCKQEMYTKYRYHNSEIKSDLIDYLIQLYATCMTNYLKSRYGIFSGTYNNIDVWPCTVTTLQVFCIILFDKNVLCAPMYIISGRYFLYL